MDYENIGDKQEASATGKKPVSDHSPPGGTVLTSRLIKRVEPQYPVFAKRLRVSGEVVFIIVVDTEGIPTVTDIINPIGLGMEESAIESISQWRYSPTILDGVAIPVTATVTVGFRLY